MKKGSKEKTLFFPNLKTVENAIKEKEFEKEIIQIEIEWDKIIDATIEALMKQSVLNYNLCKSIATYAIANCDENPEDFIDLVQQWEFIITELLSDKLITQVNQDSNDTPF